MSGSTGHCARRPIWGLLSLGFALACGTGTEPVHESDGVELAKAAGNPSVTAVMPSYAHQGDAAVAVRIVGSAFDQGSIASWERAGVTDPKISVQETRFVSSTELVATISVAPDARIDLYDVAVTTSTRKKGIGMERFIVTVAQSIGTLGGNTLARGVNDRGATVGYSMLGSSQHAFFAAPGAAMTDLGVGQAYDLDPTGTTIVGNVSGVGLVWRNTGGTWTSSPLPHNGIAARATTIATTASGLVIGGSVDIQLTSRTVQGRPALWRETATGWALQTYATPAGFSSAWIEDVNVLGQAVGVARDPYSKAYVWEADGTPVALIPIAGDRLPFAYGINPAGTVIVGASGGGAVYWKRAENGSWLPPRTLETCGKAVDINGAGMIVGQGCQNATLWTLDEAGNVTRRKLPGLGASSDAPAVEAINDAAFPIAAGKAKQQGSTDEGVVWNLNLALGM
jgi:probable HAF family extracellular repeat protein